MIPVFAHRFLMIPDLMVSLPPNPWSTASTILHPDGQLTSVELIRIDDAADSRQRLDIVQNRAKQ